MRQTRLQRCLRVRVVELSYQPPIPSPFFFANLLPFPDDGFGWCAFGGGAGEHETTRAVNEFVGNFATIIRIDSLGVGFGIFSGLESYFAEVNGEDGHCAIRLG